MAENCKVYTPDSCVSILLDEVGYISNLYGKKVLENSCGSGNILRHIVARYICDAKAQGYSDEQIKLGLENDITGIEIDPIAYQKCKRRLTYMARKYGITGVKWNLLSQDALDHQVCKYHFVIGNPPYITYHDLSIEQREKLRNSYASCQQGRFDYCYAFIEQSFNCMLQHGRLAYVLPNSILKNVWAKDLRTLLQAHVHTILDLKNQNVFEDVTLSPIILIVEKDTTSPNITFKCKDENITLAVPRVQLQADSWAFGNYITHAQHRFGDYFTVSNSVATLLNKAFLIENYTILDDHFAEVQNYRIERSILRPAASIKASNRRVPPYIIFPYNFVGNQLHHYEEDTFLQLFPNAHRYLLSYKEQLDKRAADKNAKWFEYGRSQAISHVNNEKLIISNVISGHVKVVQADNQSIPYAGLYIVPTGHYTLAQAQAILERADFLDYVKQHGVPTTGNSYRISSKLVENYRFDF